MVSLKAAIMKEMKSAMSEARDKTSDKLDDEVLGYYDRGTPVKYNRTGELIEGANVTTVASGGNELEYTAEMDGSRMNHTTGTFSESDILQATETGFFGGTLGNHAYFQRTRNEIPNILDSAFSKRFGRG